MIRVDVDRDVCDLHGQCVIAAPEIFSFDDDGELCHLDEVEDELRGKAEYAASLCPTTAIAIA